MANEIENLDKVVVGQRLLLWAEQVSSKITIILKMLEEVDNLIIGGGMTYFCQGYRRRSRQFVS